MLEANSGQDASQMYLVNGGFKHNDEEQRDLHYRFSLDEAEGEFDFAGFPIRYTGFTVHLKRCLILCSCPWTVKNSCPFLGS